MPTYKFEAKGQAANEQSWTTTGIVGGGNYRAAHEQAMRETFAQLTGGKAVCGHPGKGGCHGPYRITSVHIDEVFE